MSSLNNPIFLTREDGQHIKIKDYLTKIVTTNPNKPTVVIIPQTEPLLERNIPVYQTNSNVSGISKNSIYDTDVITKDLIPVNVTSSMSSSSSVGDENLRAHLNEIRLRRLSNFGNSNNSSSFSSMPLFERENRVPVIHRKKITIN